MMIECPNCKEEIEKDSYYCDQCGQKLLFCSKCGCVGMGRRCTRCGGEMYARVTDDGTDAIPVVNADPTLRSTEKPQQKIMLSNGALGLEIQGEHEAVIGRRTGPYSSLMKDYGYVSGTHAKFVYSDTEGWFIVDLHSSNGTAVNRQRLQPDIPKLLKNGDVVTIANVNMQVKIY